MEMLLDKTLEELKLFYSGSVDRDQLLDQLLDAELENDSDIKKFIFRFYAKKLQQDHNQEKYYDLDQIPAGTIWEVMKKPVTAVRVAQLKEVKVLRRMGKYDVKQLRQTYFGKLIFQDLEELGNRWSLSKDEYRQVEMQCKKLNLELPEIIEPTTTEKFFGDDT